MRITGSEIALLQEHGASRNHIRRVEDLLEPLDREQVQGRGAESRWSLARLLHRIADARDTMDATVRVLNRRLRLRGVLPVQRVPRMETERWRMFMWSRQFAGIFRDCLESNMMTPLQPGESDGVVGASSSSADEQDGAGGATVDGASPSTARGADRVRSRSRSRSSFSGQSFADPDCDSEFAFDSEGELVHVPDAEDEDERRGPPPPMPTHLVTLEPVGIWREPHNLEEEQNTAAPDGHNEEQMTTVTPTTTQCDLTAIWLGMGTLSTTSSPMESTWAPLLPSSGAMGMTLAAASLTIPTSSSSSNVFLVFYGRVLDYHAFEPHALRLHCCLTIGSFCWGLRGEHGDWVDTQHDDNDGTWLWTLVAKLGYVLYDFDYDLDYVHDEHCGGLALGHCSGQCECQPYSWRTCGYSTEHSPHVAETTEAAAYGPLAACCSGRGPPVATCTVACGSNECRDL